MDDEVGKQNLVHFIYSSTAINKFSEDEILELLEIARKNNQSLGVTGILLYEDGSFFQVLEGSTEVVERLFEKISADKRHSGCTKIVVEQIETRSFSEWTMGYAGVQRAQLNSIDGLNDFFVGGKSYAEIDKGRAKLLLNAFKEGKWRNSID